ncbi:restriction endonuclease subunit S [Desulfococcaceae bacterium HSG7]|nr:restriction endonuclease subunit S [Desulfococcaceae bacterium HSG7]
MNKIEQLIEELCPQGVEFRTLGEVLQRTKGTPITAKKMNEINKKGAPIKIFAGGKTVAYVEYGDIPEKDVLTTESVVVKSRGIIGFEYINKPFSHKNEFWSYHSNNSEISIKYIFYYLKNKEYYFQSVGKRMSKMPQLSIPDTDKFQIPIPPLTIQKEIVKILDNFTRLEAELEAELEARKKQYEHYREELLSFGDDVEFRAIGEIVEFAKGASIPRNKTSVDYEVPYLHYGDIYKLYNKEVDLSIEYESIIKVSIDERIRKNQYIHTGDIVYNLTSETKEDLGKAVVIRNDKDCKFIAGTETTVMKIIRKDIINPCFFNYLLMTFSYLKDFRRHTTGTKVFRVHPKAISKIAIPIPPLSKQKEIAAILNKFDALVNDISTGLPAEIAARKKQYEYYRNQLLSFQPLETQDVN